MIPKLRIESHIHYGHHRSGWDFAIQSIECLHCEGEGAVLLNTVVDRDFAARFGSASRGERNAYQRPWAGFIHVPPGVPGWLEYQKSPEYYFQLPEWKKRLPHCRGLMTLSRDLRDWVSEHAPGIPVLALHHPTEFPEKGFDFETYLRHGEAVVQVGWWLRRLSSIHFLDLPRRRKHLLIPFQEGEMTRFENAVQADRSRTNAPPLEQWDATILPRVSNDGYDELLSRSIVFLDLYAAAANNAVIECMVRRTPVLTRNLPATREYLGEEYPFFFESLEEAASKAADASLVLKTHEYLRAKDLSFLSGESFCRTLAESSMYQSW